MHRFRFLNHPSYERDEMFTVLRIAEDWLTCHSSKFPGQLMTFAQYKTTFKMFEIETDADAVMAAANVVANTPIGSYIDFSRTAQEL